MLSFSKSSAARCIFSVSLGIMLLLAQDTFAQVSLTGSTYSQNFNGIGTSASASLPTGWKVNANTFGSASTSTGAAAGTSGTGILTGSSGGNIYNLANGVTGSSTDRAVGILNSGSFTSGKCIHFAVTNNTGSTITAINISFDYEKYRSGSRAWTWTLDAGTNGSTYGTSLSDGTEAYTADGNNTTISNPPTTTSKTVSITGLSIANGSTYYLRWTLTGTGGSSNGQALGIDNFSLEACITPTAQSVTGGGGYCSGGSGVAIGLAGSESGVDYQLYNGASTVGSPVAGTGSSISFGTHTAAGTYTVVGSRFSGCSANMTGSASVSVNALPAAQTVTGGGSYCSAGAGVSVGLSGSEIGVHYQLYNGASTVGSPVPGTGAAISFGSQTAAATFTVVGTNTVTSCASDMTGSASVTIDPLPTVNVTPSGGYSCFPVTASGASTYSWSPATALDATTGATVTASPTVATTYTVTGTNSLTCTSTASVTITPATVAMSSTSPATGSVPQGTNNHLLQTFNLAVTAADATISGVTVTTSGSYVGADVNALKCWYSGSPTFSTGTATLLSTFTSPGSAGSKTFPSFTPQAISSASTGYIHITVDIDGTATGGNTIALASTSFSGFSICAATLTGTDPIAASNVQTIAAALCSGTPSAGTASPGPSVICGTGTSTVTLTGGSSGTGLSYQWSSNSVNTPPGTPISGATNDTYVTGTVSSTTYYWCTTTCASSTLSSISAVGVVSVNPVPTSSGASNDGPICVGGDVTLLANSSNATAWDWSGPDGFTSTLQNPTASPTVTGTYSLMVSSTGSGCTPATVYTTNVTVNPAPTSSGPANDGPICVGGTVSLTANSSDATSWSWSGPSGFSSTLQNPSATPTTTGTYSLTVASSGAPGCSPSTVYTTSVTVNAVPASSGPTNSGPICVGNSATLFANSTGATSWSWSGPDGYSSTLQNPTTSPTATATYSLTVSSSGNGCSPSTVYTTSVTVNSVPTISVTPPSGNSGVALTASGGTAYTWSPSTGLSATTGASVTASPTVTTTYTVSGTTSGCTGTATALVNFAGGTVTWDFTPGTSGQASSSTNTNLPASSCIASIGNSLGTVSTAINSTSASNNSGASGGNNIGNACKLGSFDDANSSYINLLLTPNSGYCLTVSDVDFGTRSTSTGAQAFTVSSDFAGFGTSLATGSIANNSTWTAKTTSITPFTAGPSTGVNVRIYGHNGSGSPGSGTINWRLDDIAVTYSVNPAPSLASASTGGAVCAGNTLSLFANTPSDVASFSWVGPDAFTSTLQNPTISGATAAASGTYTVTVNNGSGCTRTYTTIATVNPIPTSSGATNDGPICTGGTVSLSANSTNANQWSWSGPSGFNSTLQNPTSTPTATGTYSLSISNSTTGCTQSTVYTTSVTVNSVPSSSGATNDGPICVGGTVNLSANSTAATSWSWSGPFGFASTLQNPTAPPTTTGTYSLTVSSTGSGCNPSTVYTTSVTVNAVPTSGGTTNDGPICVGGTVNLSANSTGATSWSWSGPSGFASTLQNPTATPTTTGTYSLTVSSTGSGCNPSTVYTTSVTVNAVPTSSGATNDGPICVGGTVNLSANSTAATSWSWSGPSGFASTLPNPAATPTTTGTYSLTVSSTGSGCNPSTVYTTSVTVNPVPASSGATNDGPICVGGTVSLSANSTAATSWSWSGPSGFASTLQNPTATPTTTGTYSLTVSGIGSGCNPSAVYTTSVTVNPLPSTISGASDVCVGSTTTLTNSGGGTWSSSNTSFATVGSATGIVAGVAAGNVNITYTLPTTCYTTKAMTVNPVPSAVSITGVSAVCAGATTTLNPSVGGGTWSGGNVGIATINSSGVVTSLAAGAVTFTYTFTNGFGCTTQALQSFTVNPLPSTSTGESIVCVGGSIALANSTGGGTWSSSNTGLATVGSATGIVSGVAAGSADITYTISATGCYSTKAVTVNPALPAITGTTNVCLGTTTTLSNTASGGTWSSSAPSRATVGSSTGIVTGIAVGSSTISYNVSEGCIATTSVNVMNITMSVSGSLSVCVGSTSTLANASTGGAWTSGNTGIATINALTGVMTGVASGTVDITYTLASCYTTRIATVSPLPDTIGGIANVCAGSSITLTHSATGGTWSSSNTSVATIGSASGLMTGAGAGAATITYTLATSCYRTANVTIGATPAAITGSFTLCPAGTTTLTCATGGGTWSSSSSATATIGSSTGAVSAVAVGNTNITYHHSGGCIQMVTLTVNSLPDTSTGMNSVCTGGSINLTNASSGGTWSSSGSLMAVGSSTGIVTGVTVGTGYITYSLPGVGCYTTKNIEVYSTLPAIGGTTYICIGTTSTLTHSVAGGTWSSSNTSRATVDPSTGVVTGVAVGSSTITYTVSTGCYKTITVSIPNIVLNVSGSLSTCVGSTTTLTCSSTGGAWTSSNTAIAGINALTGILTGVSAGTVTVTYTLAGCMTTRTVTINAGPEAITGSFSVCAGSSTTLASATTGGSWSSGNITRATVGSTTGIVTGVAAGTVYITYSLATGCRQTQLVTVGAMPSAITGTHNTCEGSTTVLYCATSGGTWSSVNTAVATVSGSTSSTSTTIAGISAGTAEISYNHSGGCVRTTTVTVASPATANTGDSTMCVGGTATLANATSGGVWSSSNTSKAIVGSSTGVVTGVGIGTARISYILPSGCFSITQVSVNSSAAAISGASRVCVGFTTALAHSVSGGSWTSSNMARATVDASTGVVTGVSAGPLYITYSIAGGCTSVKSFYVDNVPPTITGSQTVCEGAIAALTCMPGSSGSWTSSDTLAATVNNYGVVTGISTGTTVVTYTNSAGCYVTHDMTVNLQPDAVTGPTAWCVESAASFSCTTTGGVWVCSNSSVAPIDSATGVATGVGGGIVTVKYLMPTGCYSPKTVTVNVLPGAIISNTPICAGNSIVLYSTTYGATWSGSDGAVASLASLGANTVAVTGLTTGTTTVSYTNATGCSRTVVVTVNAAMPTNEGPSVICVGNLVPLTNTASGGTWSSSAYPKASVNSTTGVVIGVGVGTANITYAVSSGCISVTPVTVNAATSSLSGSNIVCPGASVTFTSPDAGGTWASSNTSIATVNSSGVVTGVSGGTTAISYFVTGGCYSTRNVIVKASPVITGPSSVPVGSVIALSASPSGGPWSSSLPSIATVGISSGTVTGVATGSVLISYTYAGCVSTWAVAVSSPSGKEASGVGSDVVKLYPNPTSGVLSVSASGDGVLSVVDLRGATVGRFSVLKGTTVIDLPADIAPGTYICHFSTDDGDRAVFTIVLAR